MNEDSRTPRQQAFGQLKDTLDRQVREAVEATARAEAEANLAILICFVLFAVCIPGTLMAVEIVRWCRGVP
jgi:hypothetical protein